MYNISVTEQFLLMKLLFHSFHFCISFVPFLLLHGILLRFETKLNKQLILMNLPSYYDTEQ